MVEKSHASAERLAPEEEVLLEQRIQNRVRRLRQFRSASNLEYGVSILFGMILICIALNDAYVKGNEALYFSIIEFVRSGYFIAAFAVVFVQTFTRILTQRTVIAAAIFVISENPSAFLEFAAGSTFASVGNVAIEVTKAVAESRRNTYEKEEKQIAMSASRAELQMREAIARSADAVSSAKFRPTSLLFAGSMVAVLGILLFIATLPASSDSPSIDWVRRAIEILPRLVLFLFVQVLAGFFLRQYRSSLEDYRYYEAILRRREDQLTSLILRASENSAPVLEVASDLLVDRNSIRIQQGESTVIIETNKSEVNEFSSLTNSILNMVQSRLGDKDSNKSS